MGWQGIGADHAHDFALLDTGDLRALGDGLELHPDMPLVFLLFSLLSPLAKGYHGSHACYSIISCIHPPFSRTGGHSLVLDLILYFQQPTLQMLRRFDRLVEKSGQLRDI